MLTYDSDFLIHLKMWSLSWQQKTINTYWRINHHNIAGLTREGMLTYDSDLPVRLCLFTTWCSSTYITWSSLYYDSAMINYGFKFSYMKIMLLGWKQSRIFVPYLINEFRTLVAEDMSWWSVSIVQIDDGSTDIPCSVVLPVSITTHHCTSL